MSGCCEMRVPGVPQLVKSSAVAAIPNVSGTHFSSAHLFKNLDEISKIRVMHQLGVLRY